MLEDSLIYFTYHEYIVQVDKQLNDILTNLNYSDDVFFYLLSNNIYPVVCMKLLSQPQHELAVHRYVSEFISWKIRDESKIINILTICIENEYIDLMNDVLTDKENRILLARANLPELLFASLNKPDSNTFKCLTDERWFGVRPDTLIMTILKRNLRMTKYLIEERNICDDIERYINTVQMCGVTPFKLACQIEDVEIVKYLVSKGGRVDTLEFSFIYDIFERNSKLADYLFHQCMDGEKQYMYQIWKTSKMD